MFYNNRTQNLLNYLQIIRMIYEVKTIMNLITISLVDTKLYIQFYIFTVYKFYI